MAGLASRPCTPPFRSNVLIVSGAQHSKRRSPTASLSCACATQAQSNSPFVTVVQNGKPPPALLSSSPHPLQVSPSIPGRARLRVCRRERSEAVRVRRRRLRAGATASSLPSGSPCRLDLPPHRWLNPHKTLRHERARRRRPRKVRPARFPSPLYHDSLLRIIPNLFVPLSPPRDRAAASQRGRMQCLHWRTGRWPRR